MPLRPPDPDDLAKAAQHYGLGLDEADVASFSPMVHGLLASWDAVEELYAASAPAMPERAWTRPEAADNPYNAWYVTTSITGSGEGPLAGKTVAVKDNTAVAGVPMMNGSTTMEGYTPLRDATIVTRLLDAGATIAGKSVCEDLCFSGGSHTSRTGAVRNPWNETHSTGGSSSGSAALVASGLVDVGTAGDQGGSIRMPASWCGVVGHKPTWGLVPYTGAFPIEQTIDHVGPITRTVAEAALVMNVIAGPDGQDPRQPRDLVPDDYVAALGRGAEGLRVGILTEGFGLANSDPGVDAAVRAAAESLRGAGLVVEDVSVPWHRHGAAIWDVISVEGAASQMVDLNGYGLNWKGLYDPEVMEHYGNRWRADGSQFSETVKLVLLAGRHALDSHHGKHYGMAQNLAYELRAAYDEALSRYDVLVLPTTPIHATAIPDPDAPREEIIGRALEMIANTCVTDVTGHPACSVPAGLVDGLPTGMMIVGRQFDDATVLRVAHTYEQAVGGFPTPAGAAAGSQA
ncbi:amidase [Pseudonocardia sp. KRD-184]|uniref:Amidase n=1 Tax=Pseudonocardia oceani TaxID=2792013 RepID=A0ABS6UCJ3_9PSEU|nr:amidase [Pseudonocardia oceani]MBW0091162.1 amidase [Pseudonocardia oceani]MBW0096750.1 amidase [Pseudonocardia oceani]MBW0107884.1 amidase [Pseudonocardia oceani]MBW0121258.1 amidase [Pseudonocardia oceani]MBW0129950.1 amidase [Pseudonocardia oceani]